MHSDGYPVQSYEYFFMADERKTGSSLLTRLFGLAKVSTDKRVAMLYSSFFSPFRRGGAQDIRPYDGFGRNRHYRWRG